MRNTPFLILFFLLLYSCDTKRQDETSKEEQEFIKIELIRTPAGKFSEEPNLSVSQDNELLLSWIEKGNESSRLLYSKWDDGAWSSSQLIAEGSDWFVNWADFPSIIILNNGDLAAHYLQKSGSETYAYGVRIKFNQSGNTWSDPYTPHTDKTPTEHGFVSLLPYNDDELLAVWLDGRNFAEVSDETPTREMTLRSAVISPDGSLSEEHVLDDRVCDCCQTDAVLTSRGPVVVYRNRSLNEIRDISLVRYENNVWSEPIDVHSDGWEIAGCPVNGPAIDARREKIVVAWFTAAKNDPSIKVKFSDDAGNTFKKAINIEEDKPMGRVDVVMLEDGSALVSWMEEKEKDAVILVRKIYPDGSYEKPVEVYRSSASRASGFPRMAYRDGKVFFAWTLPGEESKVLTAIGTLN